jgi:hypothetical protein
VTSGPEAEATCVAGAVGDAIVGAVGADGNALGSVTGGVTGCGAVGAGNGADVTVPAGAAATGDAAGAVSIPVIRLLWQPDKTSATKANVETPLETTRIF